MGYRYQQTIKLILILILIGCAYWVSAGQPFSLIKTHNKNGAPFISIANYTNRTAYCYIKAENYFVDFYVNANSQSRWYNEPYSKWIWRCK